MAESAAPDLAVLVFTRAPSPGAVKTRLIPALGAARACALHRAMLRRTVLTALDAGIGPVTLWCAPDAGHPYLRALGAELGVAARAQQGADLGERMHAGLAATLAAGCRGAVVVGSDCPFLTAADFRRAAAALGGGDDAVLGPARDGGYVLLGVRRAHADLFADVAWGSPEVLAATRRNLARLGWRWSELPVRDDIDRAEDLALLRARAPELLSADAAPEF
ncbi:MAG: TIGR04282 family arsenosugar biosynthesis glycosyltransferase [Gammaproteobacteria bacterium]|nr:TIGR04282 family arsenosugar biosynthesis glycosyltransferase [Gammaproteobacteria bacterium]